MFLDAAFMLRDRPVAHLVTAWAALLPLRRHPNRSQPPSLIQMQSQAQEMWHVLEAAAMVASDADRHVFQSNLTSTALTAVACMIACWQGTWV